MFDARLPAGPAVVLEVAMRERDEPPCEREDHPADGEGEREQQQVPAPLDVDERREDVGEEAAAATVDVDARDVAVAALADQSALGEPRQQPPERLLAQHRRHLLRAACSAWRKRLCEDQ